VSNEGNKKAQSGLVKFLGWASTGYHDPDARYGAHVHNIGLVGMVLGLIAGIFPPFLMSEPLALVGFIPVGIMIGFLLGAFIGAVTGSFANWRHRKEDEKFRRESGGSDS
jgi:MFS family permease